MEHYIGVDLGGSNIAVGIVTNNGDLLLKKSIRTNAQQGAESVCKDITDLARTVAKEANIPWEEIAGIGVGSPGIIKDGIVINASNLNFFDVPLADMLTKHLDKRVNLENDANAAALGEAMVGVGRGYQSLVALTIGTGIGGGIVWGGRIHQGFNGAAGELGHLVIIAEGRSCACGKNGCIEAYCSATAIKRITAEYMEQHVESKMWELTNGKTENISAKTPFDAMRLGDQAGTKIVEQFLFHLSLGVSNVINLIQPEVFCIGGGVANEGDTIVLPLRELVRAQTYLTKEEDRTFITKAKFGGDAGIIGAALSVLQPR